MTRGAGRRAAARATGSSPPRVLRGALLGVVVVAGFVCAVGCETTVERPPSGRPMPSDPRAAPEVPEGVRPNAMAIMLVGPKPTDTNGNGFPDLIAVDAYLFAEPIPTPLWAEGAFVFEIYPMGLAGQPDQRPLMTWRIEGDRLVASRARTLAGRSYRIGLSLLEHGTDMIPIAAVDLTSRFEPAGGGPPILASGVRTVQILPLASGR